MFMDSVIAALGNRDFLAHKLSRQLVHCTIDDSDPAALPTWDGLNAALSTSRLQPPRIRVFDTGKKIADDQYMTLRYDRRGNPLWMIDFPRLEELLRNGAGLVIDSLDEFDPAVWDAARQLEQFTTEMVQANAYVTWGSDSGFGRHCRTGCHGAVVTQTKAPSSSLTGSSSTR